MAALIIHESNTQALKSYEQLLGCEENQVDNFFTDLSCTQEYKCIVSKMLLST